MITQPNLLPIFDSQRPFAYQVASRWLVQTPLGRISVPAGYILDGASVPRLLWSIYPPDGLYRAAVTLHDLLYDHTGFIPGYTTGFTRKQADWLLYWACVEAKVKERDAKIMYAAVRVFGGRFWREGNRPLIQPLIYQMS